MVADVKHIVLNLLARREHSAAELRRKLLRRGIVADEIELVLQQLSKAGLISNRRFTEAYTRMRISKGYGPLRIRAELQERGVEAELIEECLSLYQTEWSDYLTVVWQKKFARKIPVDMKERMKQIRFLQQRGFECEHINRLFKNAFCDIVARDPDQE